MSFSLEIKQELTKIVPDRKCCELAEIAGFLRFAGSITIMGNGKLGIRVYIDNPAVARLFITLVKEYFGSKTALSIGEGGNLSKDKTYILNITSEMNAEQILREVGMLGVKEGSNYFDDWISADVIKKRCDKKAALRGIFLAIGSVSDPAKSYHMELPCDSEMRAKEVSKLVNSFGLKSKISKRKNKFVVYIKESEQISDFLNIIGATASYFKFQDVMITKDMKNKANRIINCTAANLDKAVNAAQKQIADIKFIDEVRGISTLPDKLYITAQKRLEFPELGLSELAKEFEPEITKSGLNHRLTKISALADKMRIGG